MDEDLDHERLRQKVAEMEKRLEELEGGDFERRIQEATKRFEKIAEMGADGILVLDYVNRIEISKTN